MQRTGITLMGKADHKKDLKHLIMSKCTSSLMGAQVKGRFAPDGHYYDKGGYWCTCNKKTVTSISITGNFQDKYGNPVDNFYQVPT